MTDNDWIKQLQSTMEHHQEAAPDGLWADIEARLPQRQVKQRPSWSWHRIAASAAIALVVAGSGYLLWPSQHDKVMRPSITMTPSEASASSHHALAHNTTAEPVSPATERQASSHRAPRASSAPQSLAASDGGQGNDQRDSAAGEPHQQTAREQHGAQGKQEKQDANHPVHPQPRPRPATPRSGDVHQGRPLAHGGTAVPTVKHQPRRRAWSLGFYASNAVKAGKISVLEYGYNHMQDESNPDPVIQPIDKRIKHQAPLSLGVNVSVPLTDRLALNTGIVYTRLKSDISASEQTLHYVGVPLNVTYNLWRFKRLGIYATAGMQADFNVKATLKQPHQAASSNMDRDRVQLSALIGPGLQLGLTRGLSVYCEPTVRYYFDNGSQVLNHFKDKPLNFNLNAGFRFTIQ